MFISVTPSFCLVGLLVGCLCVCFSSSSLGLFACFVFKFCFVLVRLVGLSACCACKDCLRFTAVPADPSSILTSWHT